MAEREKTVLAAVCGRPNVGKSSLTNKLVGEKVAIVTNKAQTTRTRIYGVRNRGATQVVLLDMPGLLRPRNALGEYMLRTIRGSLTGADCALLLVEPIAHVGAPEAALIERIREERLPALLCVNKTDTVEPASLLPVMAAYHEAWDGFAAILPVSARTGEGLEELLDEVEKFAEEAPHLFPDGQVSSQPEREVMGEILREKLLLCLDQEIPHGTAVEITRFAERADGVIETEAVIYCEKAGHKGIIIGKGGETLKKISTLARRDMERFMGTKVYLRSWVKVKERWRESEGAVRAMGYRLDE